MPYKLDHSSHHIPHHSVLRSHRWETNSHEMLLTIYTLFYSLSLSLSIYIYIYIYIYRDDEIWHPNAFGRQRTMVTGKNLRTIVVSRIMKRKTVSLSPPPIQSLQGDVGVGGIHSLLAMCVSAGRQVFDHIWYWRRARQKNQHVGNFQTMENKLVAVHSSPGET